MVILSRLAGQAGIATPGPSPGGGGRVAVYWSWWGRGGVARVLGRLGLVAVLVTIGGGGLWWVSTTAPHPVNDPVALQIGPLQVAPLVLDSAGLPPDLPAGKAGSPNGQLLP